MGSTMVSMGDAVLYYLLHRYVLDFAYNTYPEKKAQTITERNVPF
jgi:hypothetical protein